MGVGLFARELTFVDGFVKRAALFLFARTDWNPVPALAAAVALFSQVSCNGVNQVETCSMAGN